MRNESYLVLREGAGLVDRTSRGRIAIKGRDRAGFLQGLLTNDVNALGEGEGCYAAYLTPQGRIIADLDLFNIGDTILLDVHIDVQDQLIKRFEEIIFAEDVKIANWTELWVAFSVHGPSSQAVVEATLEKPSALDELTKPYWNQRLSVHGATLIVARTDEFGELGFRLFIERSGASRLYDALMSAGAVAVNAATVEIARVESGRPLFPNDMNQETIPLEAGIDDRAISFTKGCYVGQEVIIRILHRGHGRIARKLVGLTVDSGWPSGTSGVPEAGAELWSNGQAEPVGRVTSAVHSPTLGQVIALGYTTRELAEPGTVVQITLRGGRADAVVTTTPFVSPRRKD